jgi:hypothetical protein
MRAAENDGKVGALCLDAIEHETCAAKEHGAGTHANEIGVGQRFIDAFDRVHCEVEELDRIAVRLEHGAEVHESKRLLQLPESRIVPAGVDQ